MTPAERQRARLEGLLARQRARAAARSERPAARCATVASHDIRNALARLVCELDPMPHLTMIASLPPARRFARSSRALDVRPTTLARTVRGEPIGRGALARVRRALVRAGALPETSK